MPARVGDSCRFGRCVMGSCSAFIVTHSTTHEHVCAAESVYAAYGPALRLVGDMGPSASV